MRLDFSHKIFEISNNHGKFLVIQRRKHAFPTGHCIFPAKSVIIQRNCQFCWISENNNKKIQHFRKLILKSFDFLLIFIEMLDFSNSRKKYTTTVIYSVIVIISPFSKSQPTIRSSPFRHHSEYFDPGIVRCCTVCCSRS